MSALYDRITGQEDVGFVKFLTDLFTASESLEIKAVLAGYLLKFSALDETMAEAIKKWLGGSADYEDTLRAYQEQGDKGTGTASDLGGIDLTLKRIHFETKGKKITITIPKEYEQLDAAQIIGYRAVTIDVTPVTDIASMLGGS